MSCLPKLLSLFNFSAQILAIEIFRSKEAWVNKSNLYATGKTGGWGTPKINLYYEANELRQATSLITSDTRKAWVQMEETHNMEISIDAILSMGMQIQDENVPPPFF